MTIPYLVGRGLLGTGLASHGDVDGPPGRIAWNDEDVACDQLADAGRVAGSSAAATWSVAWCAGASTMRSSAADMSREMRYLTTFLSSLESVLDRERAAAGVVFLASSAGGVYGSGSSATITEQTIPDPRTEYARGKLDQEGALRRFHDVTGVRCLVGRISNLYGVSQNLGKAQGLVSHLCQATLSRTPLTVTVPLETRRDYIHTVDAGRRILRWMAVARDEPAEFATKLIVSGRSAMIGEILTSLRRVSRLRPPVVFARGTTPGFPRFQSFRSIESTDIDVATPSRTLDIGIDQIWNATWRAFMRPAQTAVAESVPAPGPPTAGARPSRSEDGPP